MNIVYPPVAAEEDRTYGTASYGLTLEQLKYTCLEKATVVAVDYEANTIDIELDADSTAFSGVKFLCHTDIDYYSYLTNGLDIPTDPAEVFSHSARCFLLKTSSDNTVTALVMRVPVDGGGVTKTCAVAIPYRGGDSPDCKGVTYWPLYKFTISALNADASFSTKILVWDPGRRKVADIVKNTGDGLVTFPCDAADLVSWNTGYVMYTYSSAFSGFICSKPTYESTRWDYTTDSFTASESWTGCVKTLQRTGVQAGVPLSGGVTYDDTCLGVQVDPPAGSGSMQYSGSGDEVYSYEDGSPCGLLTQYSYDWGHSASYTVAQGALGGIANPDIVTCDRDLFCFGVKVASITSSFAKTISNSLSRLKENISMGDIGKWSGGHERKLTETTAVLSVNCNGSTVAGVVLNDYTEEIEEGWSTYNPPSASYKKYEYHYPATATLLVAGGVHTPEVATTGLFVGYGIVYAHFALGTEIGKSEYVDGVEIYNTLDYSGYYTGVALFDGSTGNASIAAGLPGALTLNSYITDWLSEMLTPTDRNGANAHLVSQITSVEILVARFDNRIRAF